MRILLSCQQGQPGHPIPAYDFWRTYFVKGLEEAGHECIEAPGIDWAEGLIYADEQALQAWRDRTWQRTIEFIQSELALQPIHLFLSYLYPQQVDPTAIELCRQWGIPCVNFYCDNVREFYKVPNEYRCFDLNWVPEYEALAMYKRAKVPHIHAPMPCWVEPEFRSCPTSEAGRATFIGSGDLLRRQLLAEAINGGASIDIRGPGWMDSGTAVQPAGDWRRALYNQYSFIKAHGFLGLFCKVYDRLSPQTIDPIPESHFKPAVFGAEYFRVTREAPVILGINRVPTARRSFRNPVAYSRLRDIEAPMAGACYLTEWTEGLSLLYDLGNDIETYRSADELVMKLELLLKDSARRRNMRVEGQQRALNENSVANSIHRIALALGL